MKDVLATIGMETLKKEDLWYNDEMLYHMDSEFGKFNLSADNYLSIFIMAPDNQPAIEKLGSLFDSAELFEREEVDFAKYT